MKRLFVSIGALACTLTVMACAGDVDSTAEEQAPVTQAPAPQPDAGIEPLPIFGEWVSNHYREKTAMFAQRDVEPGGIAVLGDSITEWGDWDSLMPGENVVNFGIAGDVTEGVLRRIDQVEAAEPSTVMLMIGTNDLGNHDMPVEEIAANTEEVLDELLGFMAPQDVYVQSVLPREPHFTPRINALNERLLQAAYERGMYFVFLHEAFWDEDWQQLNPAYTEDGLHLNAAGYETWVDFIQPYLAKFPTVPGTEIAIPAHYQPGGKTHYARRAGYFEQREVAPGQVAFLGDSITEGGDWETLFPQIDSVNFGIGWDQTSGLLNRLGQVERAAPSHIILKIGTNDIGNGQPVAAAAENVQTAIRAMKAHVPTQNILLQSVLPREPQFHAQVLELNARLERIASQEGIDWLDMHEAFLVDDQLDPAVTEDGLHLTEAGYQRWQGLLAPWLEATR